MATNIDKALYQNPVGIEEAALEESPLEIEIVDPEEVNIHADGVERHRGKRDRLLFTDSEELVHLPLAGQRRDLFRELDEVVRHAAHRGDDDDNLVAAIAIFSHAPRDIFDALGIADRGSTVFLNKQGHGKKSAFVEDGADGVKIRIGLERFEAAVFHGSLGVLEAVAGDGEDDFRAGANPCAEREGGTARI